MNPEDPATDPQARRRRLLPLFLPLAYLAHLAEEWWGGFVPWSQQFLGAMTDEKFLWINAVAWPLLAVAALLGWSSARFGVCALVAAAILGLNGALHLLASVATATYSPGAITGVVLYLPLAFFIWKEADFWAEKRLHLPALGVAVLLHGLVAVGAFLLPS